MLEKYLQEIGLSDKEATLYLALLQYDSTTPSELAKKTGLNRSTVYAVLETLEKKGLANEVSVGKIVHYEAAPPERLETFVERQKVVLDEHAMRLKDIIPQIKGVVREKGERPIVKFFEGRDGAISAYQEFYDFPKSEPKKGYYIMNSDLLAEVFTQKEVDKFRDIRKGKDVHSVVAYNRKEGERTFENCLVSTRLDENEFPITCDIAIIDDRVVISTLGESISSILIKSKDLADTLIAIVNKLTKN